MELKKLVNKDGFWWCISAILGSMFWIIPNVYKLGSTEGRSLLIATISLILLGAVIGYLRPVRPWRWGVASVLLLPFLEIIRVLMSSAEMANPNGTLSSQFLYVFIQIPLYGMIAIPAILGAYIGSYVSRKISKSDMKSKSSNISRPWLFGLFMGIIVSVIPIFFVPVYEIKSLLPYWIGGLLISGLMIGIKYPTSVWKWGIAVGLGLPIVVILKMIFDISTGSNSHNLFPFELLSALIIAAISSFPGVYLGKLFRQIIEKNSIQKKTKIT